MPATAEFIAGIDQAGAWLADELMNWLDAMRTAAATGRHHEVVDLADAMYWYSSVRSRLDCWTEVYRLGAAAAKAAGSDSAEARMLNYLGWALASCEGQPGAAVAAHDSALVIARGVRRHPASRCGRMHTSPPPTRSWAIASWPSPTAKR